MPLFSFQEQVNDVRDRFSMQEGKLSGPHEKLLELIKKLKRQGSEAIADRLDEMEQADKTYRAYRLPDEDDKKAAERGEPIKIVYPVSYAQIQTSIAAVMGIFSKVPFFELEGRGPSFFRNSKLMELELQYQLENCNWNLNFYQWLLNMFKYGFGDLNIGYEKQMNWVTKENQLVKMLPFLAFLGVDPKTTEKVVGFEGAYLYNEDPMIECFDDNVSIGEIQKGQFAFTQRKMSYNQLKTEAADKKWFNIEDLPKSRDTGRGDSIARPDPSMSSASATSVIKGGDTVIIDICYVKICPRDYELSELDQQQIWAVAMANDARLIKIEPSRFQHGQFPKAIIEYSPDLHCITNDGMAQTIDGLQNVTNWLLNSHMESVRQCVDNHFLVDPEGVEIKDIEDRKHFWRVKKGKGSMGLERWVKQFQQSDVTQEHIANADYLLQFIERTTGVTANQQGQQLPNKRSATEVRALNLLGAQRLKMLCELIFGQGLRPLGTQMIQNTQSWMEMDRFIKVSGSLAAQLQIPPELIKQGMLEIAPADLQGQFTIAISDMNSPSDKIMVGNVLKEITGVLLQQPMLVQMLGVDIPQLVTQMLMNLGVKNVSDFIHPPPPQVMQAMLMQQMMQANAPGGRGVRTEVAPDQQVAKDEAKGNVIPFKAGT